MTSDRNVPFTSEKILFVQSNAVNGGEQAHCGLALALELHMPFEEEVLVFFRSVSTFLKLQNVGILAMRC